MGISVTSGVALLDYDNTITPAFPAGVAVGDLLVTFVFISAYRAGYPNTPDGWEPIFNLGTSSDDDRTIAAFYKWFQAGDTAPAYIVGSTNVVAGGVCYKCSGVDAVTPIDDSQASLDANTSTEHIIGTLTATAVNGVILALWGVARLATYYSDNDSESTPDLTWTEDGDVSTLVGTDGSLAYAHTNIFTSTGDVTAIHAHSFQTGFGAQGGVLLKAAAGIKIPVAMHHYKMAGGL